MFQVFYLFLGNKLKDDGIISLTDEIHLFSNLSKLDISSINHIFR